MEVDEPSSAGVKIWRPRRTMAICFCFPCCLVLFGEYPEGTWGSPVWSQSLIFKSQGRLKSTTSGLSGYFASVVVGRSRSATESPGKSLG